LTSTTVVIPTYNERENLEELTERIHGAFKQDYEILVVDDSSPDGTAEEAERIGDETDRNVRVVVRNENPGLSKSVVEGFRQASGDNIIVMDADLQHPPEKAPEIAEKITEETPVVVGSRYGEDGGIDGWSTTRKIVSRGAITLAKVFAPASRKSSDPVSGFFGVRKDRVDPEKLSPHGYKILLDVLQQVNPEEIPEVGFRFSEREEGKSKLSIGEYIKYLEHLADLRLNHHGVDRYVDTRKLIRMGEFSTVGASGAVINTAIFMTSVGFTHYLLAGFLAFLGAVQWNFAWNWLITFDKPENGIKEQYAKFHAVSAGGFVVYEIALAILIGLMGLPELPSNIGAIFAGFLWNFAGSEEFAFHHDR
jgi:dolichol-phosphate mannosyltransferase